MSSWVYCPSALAPSTPPTGKQRRVSSGAGRHRWQRVSSGNDRSPKPWPYGPQAALPQAEFRALYHTLQADRHHCTGGDESRPRFLASVISCYSVSVACQSPFLESGLPRGRGLLDFTLPRPSSRAPNRSLSPQRSTICAKIRIWPQVNVQRALQPRRATRHRFGTMRIATAGKRCGPGVQRHLVESGGRRVFGKVCE